MKLPTSELDQAFCVALFVRASDQAKMMRVKVVRLQTQEFACRFLATPTDDLRDGDLRVVVTDPARHATEELERTDGALPETSRCIHAGNAWQKNASL